MADREKVIGFLQETAEYFRECRSNASFASKAENHFWELQNAANEAVELLKEREPKKIVDAGVHDMNNHHKLYYGNCPSCERRLYHKSSKYCPWCGQAVKW